MGLHTPVLPPALGGKPLRESTTLRLSVRPSSDPSCDAELFIGMQPVVLPPDFKSKSRMALILWLEQRRGKVDFEYECLRVLRSGDRRYGGGDFVGWCNNRLRYKYSLICPDCGDDMIDGDYGAFCWHCDSQRGF